MSKRPAVSQPAADAAGSPVRGRRPKLAARDVDEGQERSYSISELAQEFGITTRTIRFYESRGLISPERQGTSRSYSRRDRARLMLILRGRNLGFSVEDVGDYLALYDADPGQMAQTKMLLDKVTSAIGGLERKRADIDAALADLRDIAERCARHLKGA